MGPTFWGQLRKFREEPVAVFKEPVHMDGIEIIPVLVCMAVVVLYIETNRFREQLSSQMDHMDFCLSCDLVGVFFFYLQYIATLK